MIEQIGYKISLASTWRSKIVIKTTVGILFRLTSLWIGVHYSHREKRYCVNLLPCVTIWIALPGGQRP